MTDNKRLYRSRLDRMLGGVCGGLGEFFGIDSTLIRIAFALSGAFWLYLILLIIVPEESFPIEDVIPSPAENLSVQESE
ncbi:MAG: hypothetical protein B6243_10405 [Anaerolineaceae bacterium 4572_5.2]|nr:MAG: hypothetical protein B6243_10405 [Anaerolineaceae bacterium 4572_5.2]